jgi:hypothetical protein
MRTDDYSFDKCLSEKHHEINPVAASDVTASLLLFIPQIIEVRTFKM